MKPQELRDHLNNNPNDYYILDVREPDELDVTIDGSHNLPLSVFAQALQLSPEQFKARFGFDRFTKSDKIIAVCFSGARSARITQFLKQQGYDIQNLEGGMINW